MHANQIADALTATRLSLHVLSGSIWVGGQLVMPVIVSEARKLGSEAPKNLAQAFAKLSWPSYALLIISGFWNLAAVTKNPSDLAWKISLAIMVILGLGSGLAAYLHQVSKTAKSKAIYGSLSGSCAVIAMIAGVLVAG